LILAHFAFENNVALTLKLSNSVHKSKSEVKTYFYCSRL